MGGLSRRASCQQLAPLGHQGQERLQRIAIRGRGFWCLSAAYRDLGFLAWRCSGCWHGFFALGCASDTRHWSPARRFFFFLGGNCRKRPPQNALPRPKGAASRLLSRRSNKQVGQSQVGGSTRKHGSEQTSRQVLSTCELASIESAQMRGSGFRAF